MIEKMIQARKEPWSPDLVRDPVQARLAEIIETKRKAAANPARKSKAKAAEPAPAGNVVSIMDALRRSVASDKKKR